MMRISSSSRFLKGLESEDVLTGIRLPLGYHLQFDADLLTVRRSDGSFWAAFNVRVDPFEVERVVWEDAD